jgi:hypothetical protein
MSYSTCSPRTLRRAFVLGALVFGTACASAGGGGGGGGGGANTITRDQFNPEDENAYLIVRRLRPAWLRPRSQESISGQRPTFAQVFVDETQVGDANALEGISSTQIDRIEYLSALDATTRFGTGFAGGLIIVRTINSGPG